MCPCWVLESGPHLPTYLPSAMQAGQVCNWYGMFASAWVGMGSTCVHMYSCMCSTIPLEWCCGMTLTFASFSNFSSASVIKPYQYGRVYSCGHARHAGTPHGWTGV